MLQFVTHGLIVVPNGWLGVVQFCWVVLHCICASWQTEAKVTSK
jgi:hypothetical protein